MTMHTLITLRVVSEYHFINTKDALCWIYKYCNKEIQLKPETKLFTNSRILNLLNDLLI